MFVGDLLYPLRLSHGPAPTSPVAVTRRRSVALAAGVVLALIVAVADGQETAPLTTSDPAALKAPPRYHGVRLDRTWTPADAFRPFGAPDNFANTRLPADAPLDTGTITTSTGTFPVNPAAAGEIARQAATYGTYLNRAAYTTPVTIVPTGTPLTPVGCWVSCSKVMNQISSGLAADNATDLHGGFPIPDGYAASQGSDTDGEAAFYQPDYVSPCNPGWKGRLYEAWRLRPNTTFDPAQPVSPANPRWTARSVGRVVDVTHSPGHYKAWTYNGCQDGNPGAPDSTWQYKTGMGVLASGLLIPSDEVSREDCELGTINHAVGLLVHESHPTFRAPATRTDGYSASYPIEYGMRLRFPAAMAKPTGLTRIGSMLFDAAQRYGLVIDDRTVASVGFRLEPTPGHTAAPECTVLLDGRASYQALAGFPWRDLQVLAP